MKPENIRRQIEAAGSMPLPVRLAILANPHAVRPGAIPALDRFFTMLRRLKAPQASPPPAAFRAAAQSEPTLATLLTALEKFAPQVCLAEGRDLRRACYKNRKRPAGAGPRRRKGPAPLPATAPAIWPGTWQAGYSDLIAGCRRETVARQYVARLNQCAATLTEIKLPPDLDRFTMILIGQELSETRAPITIANYIDASLALAKALDAPETTLVGIRDVATVWRNRAKRRSKAKVGRISDWTEKGNSYGALIAETMAMLDGMASAGSSWRAAAARQRRVIAILIVSLNTVARTGDQALWRIGRDLQRRDDASWFLSWRQQKTDNTAPFGELWPETARALDLHLLGGRSEAEIESRYAALKGMNWITLEPEGPSAKYASSVIKELTGLPGHDLRTLAADLLRLIDPEKGPSKISALLMHTDPRSQKDYVAAGRGLGAARAWDGERRRLRKTSA
jgi:hypothetical protein